MWIVPEPFESDRLLFEPLSMDHAEELFKTAPYDTFEYWGNFQPVDASFEAFSRFLEQKLALTDAVSYVVRDKTSQEVVAKSSMMEIRPGARGFEIGMTWISPQHRGTWVNPAKKLAMLTRGFDHNEAVRIQLKTDAGNLRSRRAIEKIGGQFEGILRAHRVRPNGEVRDTAMYSITNAEWPGVKKLLQERLEALCRNA